MRVVVVYNLYGGKMVSSEMNGDGDVGASIVKVVVVYNLYGGGVVSCEAKDEWWDFCWGVR